MPDVFNEEPIEDGDDDIDFGEDINSRDQGYLTLPEIQELQEENSESTKNGGAERGVGPKPEKAFWFEVVGKKADSPDATPFTFNPKYYPARFTSSKDRDTESESDVCKGENISINKVNNYRVHANGLLLMDRKKKNDELADLHALADHEGSLVDVVTPLLPEGGIECLVKTVEFGEIKGWDPHEKAWTIEYTVDFIATGKDGETSGEKGIVTAVDDDITGLDDGEEIEYTGDLDFDSGE
jgi:hypothetical protein